MYLRTGLLTSRNIQQSLENLRITLGLSHSQWAAQLRMKPAEYKRFCLGQVQISIHTCVELAQKYHFSLEDLWLERIDLRAVLAKEIKDETYVNPRYSRLAFSKFHTAHVMFDFLEKRYGLSLVATATRKFQIQKRFFYGTPATGLQPKSHMEDEGWISNLFFSDLLAYLERLLGVHPKFFFEMGAHSTTYHSKPNSKSHLKDLYSTLRNARSVFDHLFGEFVPHYELNSEYELLSLTKNHCRVRTRTRRDIAGELRIKNLGSPAICTWKAGLFSSAPRYLGLKSAVVEEPLCVHRGDPFCVFDLYYSGAQAGEVARWE